jgi:drug/metabolite transporter (DMT)-like permease
LLAQWRLWGTICLLAGAPFGLLMFGGLQFAPASHAAVFPFAAMSVMGSVLSAWFLGDALTPRKLFGIGIVLLGLLVLSGIDANQLNGSTLFGDALFVAAGAMWAGFGVLLRKHRLSPVTATALISASALVLYVPMYLIMIGPSRLLAASPVVFWTEVLVQGVIAGAGTLYTYSKMVALLGADRAAVFPALAPGIAAVVAWPVLGHIPGTAEIAGLTLAMVGIIITVTRARRSAV